MLSVTWRRYIVVVVFSVVVLLMSTIFLNQREAEHLSTYQADTIEDRSSDTPPHGTAGSVADRTNDSTAIILDGSVVYNAGNGVTYTSSVSAAQRPGESMTSIFDDIVADNSGKSLIQSTDDITVSSVEDDSAQIGINNQVKNRLINEEDKLFEEWPTDNGVEDIVHNRVEDKTDITTNIPEDNIVDNRVNKPASIPSVCATSARATRIQDLCTRHGYDKEPISWMPLLRNLIVDDKHRIMFCSIPKCGSKSFKHYLGQLSTSNFSVGWSVNMRIYFKATGLRLYADLSEPEREMVLKEYLKFFVVRHPFDRLRSAWQHKMGEAGSSHVLKGKEDIVDDHLRELDPSRKTPFDYRDDFLGFEPFLELVYRKWDAGFQNAHWISFYQHCQPCHVPYDHVFRLETLQDDVDVLYRHLSALNSSEPVLRITHDNKVRAAEGIEKMKEIKQVYQNIDKQTIRGLVNLYRRDFSLFGYKWKDEGGATCLYNDLQCC